MSKQEKLFAITGMLNYITVVFLNAFTDLGHKIIIQNTVFKVYDGSTQIMLTAIVNALVLFPFILVFSPAGFLADKYAKSHIIRHSAFAAIILTMLITFAYYQGWFLFAFSLTFLLALQSAVYSPAKYGYVKELVGEKFLSAGNAAVQAATTVAILGGIITYTILFESHYRDSLKNQSEILQAIAPLGWFLILGAIVQWLLTFKLPNLQQKKSEQTFSFKRYFHGGYLRKNIKAITRKKEILDAIFALAFFWSISQVVLAIFGEYAKSELGITNTIYIQGTIALAGIGIVVGSVITAKLSRDKINLGLTGIGAVFITLIVFFVPLVQSLKLIAFMFISFGIFSAFLLVPLNAQIQHLTANVHLGRVLAANNFVQNIFMFTFLIVTTLFAYFGMNAEVLFYCMGFVGVFLVLLLFKHYSTEIFWIVVKTVLPMRYKFNFSGVENLSEHKAILLLGNHISWIDWAIVQLSLKRNVYYVMDKDIYSLKWLRPVLQKAKIIPISSKAFKDAINEASNKLKNGEIVVIFPEGKIAENDEVSNFQKGFELIDKQYEGVVVPFYIDGLFGSVFAKNKTPNQHKSIFIRRRISIVFGEPLMPETTAYEIEMIVKELKENSRNHR